MPVSPLVVCDVSLHLVLNNFIWQEYPFNPGNLQPQDMESSSGKTTIKGAGGGEKKNNCKLFRPKSSWRSGSDRKRSVLPTDCFLFIFWQGELESKRHMQPRDVLFMYRFTHEISPISPSDWRDRTGHKGVWRSVKGERNQHWWVRKSRIIWPPGTHKNNMEWYQHVVTCSPAVWLDLDGRSDDLKSDPTQRCVVQHKCQAKR